MNRPLQLEVNKSQDDSKIVGTKSQLILTIWKEDKEEDRKSKKTIINFLKLIIVLQHFITIGIIVCVGFGWWKFEEWFLSLILIGFFVEIVIIFKIVVKSLFPENSSNELISVIKEMINHDD